MRQSSTEYFVLSAWLNFFSKLKKQLAVISKVKNKTVLYINLVKAYRMIGDAIGTYSIAPPNFTLVDLKGMTEDNAAEYFTQIQEQLDALLKHILKTKKRIEQ